MNTSPLKSLMALCAIDIMSRNITLIPRKMSLQGAARMLARAGVTGAPIVDDDGHCVGVLSTTDFMHAIEKETNLPHSATGRPNGLSQPWEIPECAQASCTCVEHYMTRDPVLVAPGTPIGKLAQIMMDAHIHRTIVIDPVTHSPCGIVSSTDIIAALARFHSAEPTTGDSAHEYEIAAGAMT